MNEHDNHLQESTVEALACGRDELASAAEREHTQLCNACASRVSTTRELAAATQTLLMRSPTATPEADIDAWVSEVLERRVPLAVATTAARLQPEPEPEPASQRALGLHGRSLWTGLLPLGLVAAAALTCELPTVGAALRILREVARGGLLATHTLLRLVPGGRVSVSCSGIVLACVLILVIRRVAAGSGEFEALGRRMAGLGLFILPGLLALAVALPSVHALDFQGTWDDQPRPVTLTLEHVTTAEALRRAAAEAGVSLVASLPDAGHNGFVTLSVKDVPLKAVVEAVLGDASVSAKLDGGMLVIRSQEKTAAATPAPTAQPVRQDDEDDDDDHHDESADNDERDASKSPAALPQARSARASDAHASDRITFGGDVLIAQGQRVQDVVSMGGEVDVAGEVLGDVVTMGGDLTVRSTGVVVGDVVTMGGRLITEPGATLSGSRAIGAGSERAETRPTEPAKTKHHEEDSGLGGFLMHIAHFALLFLLGMSVLGLVPERIWALQRTVARAPGRAFVLGLLGFFAAVVSVIVLVITIIGIPAAIVLLVALPSAAYLGLVAFALMIGAALPLERFRSSPLAQLAGGVLLLYVLSLIPFVGTFSLVVAGIVGIGSVLLTRFSTRAFGEL